MSYSVWNTAPTTAPMQRRGRYLPGSAAHPAKMLPGIAAHAIRHYTNEGDLVFDPMCGIGTTLVEALHLGRNALGVEYEPRWAALARANTEHALQHTRRGLAEVVLRGRPPPGRPHRSRLPRPRRPGDHLTPLRRFGPRPGQLH